MKQSRFPGAKSFETNQKHIFFGRDEDTVRLHQLIKLSPLVVLYAKSGMGKSSLLNAGIIPNVLQEGNYEPISVRFKPFTEGGEINTPTIITRQTITQKKIITTTFLDSLINDAPSLWHDLKNKQINDDKKLLIIFDQFEELFTYPTPDIKDFSNSLAEVLYTKIPQQYRDVLEKQIENNTYNLTRDEYKLLQEPIDLRVVIAIRSDSMSLLNKLTSPLQTILKNLFELPSLTVENTTIAIREPARYQTVEFSSPHFDFEPQAIKKITNFLTQNNTKIESTQVQIICQSIESKIHSKGQVITESDLVDLGGMIENYYYNQLKQLGNEKIQLASRQLIEEGLIFEEEERRLPSLYDGQIIQKYGLTEETLKLLVDVNLLHSEPSLQGGNTYELTHDTLVKPILKAKRKRLDAERQEREILLKIRKEEENREILAAKKQQELEIALQLAKKEQEWRIWSNAISLVLIAIILTLWQSYQVQKELEQKLQAEKSQSEKVINLIFADGKSLIAVYNKESNAYGFVDKNFQQVIDSKYDQVLPFDYTGYAKVRIKDTSFLVDIFGNQYPLATTVEQLNSSIRALDLRKNNLRTIPEDIFQNRKLQILFLNQNNLTQIEGIEKLKDLLYLDLHGNNINKIPPKINLLVKLNTIDISDNRLLEIPIEIGQLQNLETLDLSNNKLANLPPELGNLSILQYLYLQNNILTGLPEEISKLSNLKTLKLNDNKIKKLSFSFSELRQLEKLYIKGNSDSFDIPERLKPFVKD